MASTVRRLRTCISPDEGRRGGDSKLTQRVRGSEPVTLQQRTNGWNKWAIVGAGNNQQTFCFPSPEPGKEATEPRVKAVTVESREYAEGAREMMSGRRRETPKALAGLQHLCWKSGAV